MEEYERAYRDPKSPLTPILPLNENKTNRIFNFDSADDKYSKIPIHYLNVPNVIKIDCDGDGILNRNIIITAKNEKENFGEIRSHSIRGPTLKCSPTQLKLQKLLNETNNEETNKKGNSSKKYDKKNNNLEVSHLKKNSQWPFVPLSNLTPVNGNNKQLRIHQHPYFKHLHNNDHHQQQHNHSYFRVSNIKPKPLSPRTDKLLEKNGLTKYKSIFQREEINLTVVEQLSLDDLITLGVEHADDRYKLYDIIKSLRT